MTGSPPPDPGRVILWLLAIVLFIVVLILIFNLADVHFDAISLFGARYWGG